MQLSCARVDLVLQSVEATLARVNALSPEVRAEISADWLALATSVNESSPWIHWFSIIERTSGVEVGSCAFKGPPSVDGMVEIAYGIEPDFQRRGFATEAAGGLRDYALSQDAVRVVRAHTLLDGHASQRVLEKCGFQRIGEVVEPDDGLVLRWECTRS